MIMFIYTQDLLKVEHFNTTSNYDSAYTNLKDTDAFNNSSYTNRSNFYVGNNYIGTGTQEQLNAVCYIFNSQESGEYTL